ncbi:MAG: MFS transporter [Cellulomonas sp.]|nr:MFS transporter [Cellulomonas sp.]
MQAFDDLRRLLALPRFRRLFTVRIVSQAGDGMFQVGLATQLFFSPERMTTATGVASAFAVLLLPFTVVGPFAGPLLDRWRRRQVLALGNALRVVLTLALAVVIVTAGVAPAVYALALVTLGVNRFLLSALSAGQPQVVPADRLVIANSLTPTLGGVSAVAGAGIGALVGWLTPSGGVHDGVVLVAAAATFGAASALALRLTPDELGPSRDERPAQGLADDLRTVAADLVAGARYLVARRTPGAALAVMAGQRFVYGVNFLALILISRNLLSDPHDSAAGMGTFVLLTGLSFAGNGIAVVLTPIAHQWIDPPRWIQVALVIGALSQVLLTLSSSFVMIAAGAMLLGLSVQSAKIAVDTIVQRDTADTYRGRAFALYDMLYNAAFVGAAALAAALLPDTGWSRPAFAALAVACLVIAWAYGRTPAVAVEVRSTRPGAPVPDPV